jgi:chromosome segregation ATPase
MNGKRRSAHRLRNERNKLRVDLEAAASSLARANDAITKLSADFETTASSLAEAKGANVKLREDIMRQYSEYKAAVDRQNDEIDQTRNEYETEALKLRSAVTSVQEDRERRLLRSREETVYRFYNRSLVNKIDTEWPRS